MKYLGAAVIPVILSFLSVTASRKIRKRAFVLEETYMLLNEMKMTLEYSCLPMFELICQLSQKESYCETFLSECRNLLENGTDFPVAWSLSVRHADIYNPEERQKLLQLGSFLGTSDVDSQVSIIDMYIQSFDEYRKDAKSKSKKYADTFIYVGVFCALGLFVMLI